ncbi:hypothetical protein [Streptomyces cadmiisoli]|uniref:hypothetical protein n=1 Tax=Streptomyces cadmiisoli TaxID=2184053 RepID=UPI00364DA436
MGEDHDDGTVARVAAIDIAKASGMVCLRVPHDAIEGRRVQQVWNVASTTNAILELGDRLVCQGVESGSSWKRRARTGARSSTCWKPADWTAGSSTRAM